MSKHLDSFFYLTTCCCSSPYSDPEAKHNLKMLVGRLTFTLKISTVGLHNRLSRLIFQFTVYYSFQKFKYPGLNTTFWLSGLRWRSSVLDRNLEPLSWVCNRFPLNLQGTFRLTVLILTFLINIIWYLYLDIRVNIFLNGTFFVFKIVIYVK